jgi:hypothetical protein
MPERKRRARPPRRPARRAAIPAAAAKAIRTLERRLGRLTAAREADRRRHAREVETARRAVDRRLAAMMSEIASLRHHEARAAALERLLTEREARIARLEALLQAPTELA